MKLFFTRKLVSAQLTNTNFEKLRKYISIELLRTAGWCIPEKCYITKKYLFLYYSFSKTIS